jgi:DNA polymerase-3 subunit delta'
LYFSQIVGQARPIGQLKRAVAAGKLAHAYLFAGAPGVGKATTAKALAAELNCSESNDAPGQQQACGACSHCERIAAGTHPDVIEVAPDGRFIKIDQIRALEQLVVFPPHEGRYRVVIIDEADKLNANAANALLKSVEEPRKGTLFVLISSAVHAVMPTLISRCQRIRFLPLCGDDMMAVVTTIHPDVDPAVLRDLVNVADGSPGRALDMMANEELGAAQQTLDQLLRAAAVPAASRQRASAIFAAAAEAGRERPHLVRVTDLLRARLRSELLQSLDQPAGATRDVLDKISLLAEAREALDGNVSPALVFEQLALCLERDDSGSRATQSPSGARTR